MADFVVQSLLQVIFLRESHPFDAFQLWEAALQARPDTFQKQPDGASQAQGEVSGLQLTIAAQPAVPRVDVHVQGIGTERDPPVVADIDNAVALATRAAEALISIVAPGRLASVITAHLYADSLSGAVDEMRKLLPGLPAPKGTDEATFRIVKACNSPSVPGRSFKQICTWQVAQISYFQLSVSPAAAVQPAPQVLQRDAVVATFDIFGTTMADLDRAAALRELRDVTAISVDVLKGGPNELR